MRNTRPLLVIAISLAIGLLAVALGYKWVQGQATFATNQVVVATRDLEPGTRLEAGMLKVTEFPAGTALKEPFKNVSDVEGRVVLTPITSGEPLLATKLAAPGEAGGLAAVLPPGSRAITVKVNEIAGVAGFTLPGSYVDIMVNTKDDASKSISKIVLERVHVLAIAQDVSTKDKAKVVNAVTLEVTPEQAERIDLARSVGDLSLVLRNQSDKEPTLTAGARKNDLIKLAALEGPSPDTAPAAGNGNGGAKRAAAKPAPRRAAPAPAPKAAAPAAAPRQQFEIIRGSTRSVEEIPSETSPT